MDSAVRKASGRQALAFRVSRGGDRMAHEDVTARLMAENEEFRRLRAEHQSYEHELDTLKARPSLSADQHWRISELKKLKLMAKDRMEVIARQARLGVSA
jgi:uncharacterized protein YdcH (DUF465 family)